MATGNVVSPQVMQVRRAPLAWIALATAVLPVPDGTLLAGSAR